MPLDPPGANFCVQCGNADLIPAHPPWRDPYDRAWFYCLPCKRKVAVTRWLLRADAQASWYVVEHGRERGLVAPAFCIDRCRTYMAPELRRGLAGVEVAYLIFRLHNPDSALARVGRFHIVRATT